MFHIDDYVVHCSGSVYKIVDIRKEKDFDGNDTEFYVLQPVYGNLLTIKTPVKNATNLIRGILTKEKLLTLIAGMPEKETTWIEDSKRRSVVLKELLKSWENEEWIKLIRTVYLKKEEDPALVTKTDEELMKKAERQLYEEFSIVLNIAPDEVLPYILEHVPSHGELA